MASETEELGSSKDLVVTLLRGLRLLDCFAPGRPEMTLPDELAPTERHGGPARVAEPADLRVRGHAPALAVPTEPGHGRLRRCIRCA